MPEEVVGHAVDMAGDDADAGDERKGEEGDPHGRMTRLKSGSEPPAVWLMNGYGRAVSGHSVAGHAWPSIAGTDAAGAMRLPRTRHPPVF